MESIRFLFVPLVAENCHFCGPGQLASLSWSLCSGAGVRFLFVYSIVDVREWSCALECGGVNVP